MEFMSLKDTFATKEEFDIVHSDFLKEFSTEKNVIMGIVGGDQKVEAIISNAFRDVQTIFFDASQSYVGREEDFDLNKYDQKLLIARELFANLKTQYNIAA